MAFEAREWDPREIKIRNGKNCCDRGMDHGASQRYGVTERQLGCFAHTDCCLQSDSISTQLAIFHWAAAHHRYLARALRLGIVAMVGGCGPGEPTYLGKSSSQWESQLKAESPQDRLAAVDALTAMGTQAVPAMPALMERSGIPTRESGLRRSNCWIGSRKAAMRPRRPSRRCSTTRTTRSRSGR